MDELQKAAAETVKTMTQLLASFDQARAAIENMIAAARIISAGNSGECPPDSLLCAPRVDPPPARGAFHPESEITMNERDFLQAYERLAELGRCDSAPGAEYRRVLAEWRSVGCPTEIDDFIVARANVGLREI